MANQPLLRKNFCDLPQELRDKIYEHVFADQPDRSISMKDLQRWSPHMSSAKEDRANFPLALALSRYCPIVLVNRAHMADALDIYLKRLQISTRFLKGALDEYEDITPSLSLLFEKVRKVTIEGRYWNHRPKLFTARHCPYENLSMANSLFPNAQEVEILLGDSSMNVAISVERHFKIRYWPHLEKLKLRNLDMERHFASYPAIFGHMLTVVPAVRDNIHYIQENKAWSLLRLNEKLALNLREEKEKRENALLGQANDGEVEEAEAEEWFESVEISAGSQYVAFGIAVDRDGHARRRGSVP